ncbi:DUF4062 domain-containing protein [Methylovulum psychrotolerans]|uniref:DUF4062 domain-containing protein n=1 Tax=Methylovulum psychrotolerans TaxID=1704499 RepID=A0A1Z4BTU5_9GAMM|nr:DUF4062 domain-containing protein [Methylovulum psychrotolerans]ASF44725.1 hypothetical protein CEK71_00840 [Methylovulum psychrotolerans]
MEKRYQIFVSSTYADLQDERKKVIQTLLQLDCIPAGMELFPAADEDQFEFIKRIIDDCDYYLLIIGGRYGTLTAKGISYTEQEYEYALERQLKVIALLHKNPDQLPLAKSEQKPKLRAQLNAFRKKVSKGRLVEFWQNEEELPGIVALSLPKTIKMFPAVGWVRANKVSSEELLTEINELRKQNQEMSKALSEIEPSIFTSSEEKDFSYIYSQLNRFENISIDISVRNNAHEETKKYSINLASLISFVSTSEKYDWYRLSAIILGNIPFDKSKDKIYSVEKLDTLENELLMYGLLIKSYSPPYVTTMASTNMVRGDNYHLIFSEKFERYRYWLVVNGNISKHIDIISNDS